MTTWIRWRLNDPAEENRQRWTRVHLIHPGVSLDVTPDPLAPGRERVQVNTKRERTYCGLDVPEFPYMEDRDGDIPSDADECKRCRARFEFLQRRNRHTSGGVSHAMGV